MIKIQKVDSLDLIIGLCFLIITCAVTSAIVIVSLTVLLEALKVVL